MGPTAPTQPHHPVKDYASEEANGSISLSPLIHNKHSQCHEGGVLAKAMFLEDLATMYNYEEGTLLFFVLLSPA